MFSIRRENLTEQRKKKSPIFPVGSLLNSVLVSLFPRVNLGESVGKLTIIITTFKYCYLVYLYQWTKYAVVGKEQMKQYGRSPQETELQPSNFNLCLVSWPSDTESIFLGTDFGVITVVSNQKICSPRVWNLNLICFPLIHKL